MLLYVCTLHVMFLITQCEHKVHATPIYVLSNSVITLSKGPNILCRYKRGSLSVKCMVKVKVCRYTRVSLSVRCMVKVKENYFKVKCRPAGILLNVNGMIYFKFKLQLKFRYKKILFSNCKFPYRFTLENTLNKYFGRTKLS